MSYIGETGRNLKKRLVEHKAAVKRCDTKNGIAVHAWKQQHRVNWDEASVLVQEPRLQCLSEPSASLFAHKHVAFLIRYLDPFIMYFSSVVSSLHLVPDFF